jgi:hypothetical protein
MAIKKIPIGQLIPNPNNPRVIRDVKFEELCNNISRYPKLLYVRPIVVESQKNPVIIGGNMRYRALCHLGYNDIPEAWVRFADELSPAERQAFIILDNAPFGEWDYEALANEWGADQLSDLGLDLPTIAIEEPEREPEPKETTPSFKLEVTFKVEEDQIRIYNYLSGKGFDCKIINK